MTIQLADDIHFQQGKTHHTLSETPDKALYDSLNEIACRPPMTYDQASFLVQSILNGEYIPLMIGAGLGAWNGRGYYSNVRYNRWYKWFPQGPLGPGFYEAILQSMFPEISVLSPKFIERVKSCSV